MTVFVLPSMPPRPTPLTQESAASVIDTLHRAREILRQDGWTQDVMYRPGEGFCLVGALAAASNSLLDMHSVVHTMRVDMAHRAVLDTLCMRQPWRSCLTSWNDDSDRTKADVLALIDATIARLDVRDGRPLSDASEVDVERAVHQPVAHPQTQPGAQPDEAQLDKCPDDVAALLDACLGPAPSGVVSSECYDVGVDGDAQLVGASRQLVDAGR